jgi:hypothetical protein
MTCAPLAGASKRTSYSIWIVEHLECCLGPGANLALIEGMERIALDLDCAPTNHPCQHATPSRTDATDGGYPVGLDRRMSLRRTAL